ncbi:SHOCT domain-containing protein [uncultured Neptuniibacter sp.]|uniref:SHOCT domain-containing protein n=1 Tax=uncultured Neptuniibacter sp. TaxID=502143 RepID=UPI002608F37B|nr:SHOCT domain-containing protein [uncultured Neptuniibacter sp.]
MWHADGMFSSGWHGFGMIIWLLIIAVVIVLIVKALSGRDEASSTAIDILDERYAKGEISEEEYLKMKAELDR